ncbi:MAG: DUF5686 family protein [Gracilimonas sp.]|nr:DUF5686 family protein [Gracilimonas sp.]
MFKVTAFIPLLLLAVLSDPAVAQKKVSGKIVDVETGDPLPAAHVIIKDTYKGTISNQDGEYSISVPDFPVTIVVRFLGFESQEKVIDDGAEPVDFLMKPSVADMGEIVVTGEDPAIAIMREVIRRKKEWRANLKTYKAEAYTRQQLRNDTTIISITESISEVYWDKKKGNREILKSKRQTANIDAADNFAGVSYLPNFYDDNLDIAGFNVMGVTHPDALKFYDFGLEDIQSLDGQVVYELKVTSKRKLQPLFEGTIFVLGEEYAVLEMDLKPNSVIQFPAPIQDFDLSYKQQFSNFGGEFWLPVDVRIEGLVEVGMVGLRFPAIGFRQVGRLSDYEVNVTHPDTIFNTFEQLTVDSTTIDTGDSLFVNEIEIIPLDTEEQIAYEKVDSTASIEKAFRPEGFLTRFIDWDEEDDNESSGSTGGSGGDNKPSLFSKLTRNLSPLGHFNRVDAFYFGLKHERRYVDGRLQSRSFVGYSTGYGNDGLESLSYGVKLGWWPLKETRRFAVFSEYRAKTETRYNSDLFSPGLTTITSITGYPDYFDYYRNEGIQIGASYRMREIPGSLRFSYINEDHSEIDYSTNYDILGRDEIQRPNSYIEEGNLSAFRLIWSEGDDKKALGAVGADDFEFSIEQSATMLGSDWNYTRFKVDLYRQFETFYQRRFFPNTLNMRLNAGTYLGDLPIQKNEVLDVAPGIFTPFGAFRTKRFIPYEGASYVAFNAEHNFKSVPLEMLGWRNASKTGLSIITFGGIGKTWVKEEQVQEFNSRYGLAPITAEDLHMEVGVSLSNIFNLFRADVAYRVDQPGFFFGVSVARLF